MLTRRENLLIRPWQERRYIYHREKVQSAVPAIDNATPPHRPHVSCKLKKIQKEAERCSQIVSDNFTLLQHLSNIMSTTRVDHFWEEPPPNFLQRVGIYKTRRKAYRRVKTDVSEDEQPRTRKDRCYGCSPERFPKVEIIPEERIPFPPPKRRVTRRAESPPDWEKQYQFRCSEDRPEFRGKVWKKPERRSSNRQVDMEKRHRRRRRTRELMEESQSIYLSKDGLMLAVKFPSKTEILMSNQRGTRVIERELCECKSFPRKLSKLVKSNGETLTLQSPEKVTLHQLEEEIENDTLINVLKNVANLKVNEEEKEESNGILSQEITSEEMNSDDEKKLGEAEESIEIENESPKETNETIIINDKSEEDTDNFFDQFIKEEFKETSEMKEEEEYFEDEGSESEQVLLEEESFKEDREEENIVGDVEEKGAPQSEEQTDLEETSQTDIQEHLGEEFEKQNSEEIDFDFWCIADEVGNDVERESEDVVQKEKQLKEESYGGARDDSIEEDKKGTVSEAVDVIEEKTTSQEYEEANDEELSERDEENVSEESIKESAVENIQKGEEAIMEKKDEEAIMQRSVEEENTNEKIEQIFESVENVIAEEDWLDELDVDLIEAMRENRDSENGDIQREK